MVKMLFPSALTVAILAAVESLLSAVIADGMIGGRHKSNMELVAQGVANMVCPLFGGMPATGAIARTATNVKNGGRTPVAGMVHALVLLGILAAAGNWAARIPLACLAAILVVVSYHMSEWRSFVSLLSAPKQDIAVLMATFLLTVFVDLTVAVEVGMVLAAFLFMNRVANLTQVRVLTRDAQDPDNGEGDRPQDFRSLPVPEVFSSGPPTSCSTSTAPSQARPRSWLWKCPKCSTWTRRGCTSWIRFTTNQSMRGCAW
jgi:SulP family sulfate permease